MDDFAAIIAGLDGWSLFIGAVAGLVIGVGLFMLTRYNMKKTFQRALEAQKESFENALTEMKSSFSSLSAKALTSSQQDFLNIANDKFEGQTERHENKLDEKEKLIDQQLGQMSDTLKEVPVKLNENQKNVSDVLDKSTQQLKESNQTYLNQLSEKADAQTKEHVSKLEDKETQINRTLGEMKDKLGKVEELIQEFEKARESKLGALDDQLKSLTATTSSLQRALADNRARGQWGERMAEDMLKFMGLVEGVNYIKQSALEAGTKPDFTFLLPNEKSLNMDVKFPLDNYLHYFDAETDTERRSYSDKFLKDVNARVIEIRKRGYIGADTLDCVIIFIPNEQIYRFIHEQNHQIIDNALKQKVIICSPLTLYIVLAVIRQAAQNFNIEQRSQEIVDVVNDIRIEWDKYTGQMDKLERRFKGMHEDFHALTGTRTRQLDRKFVKIDSFTKSNSLQAGDGMSMSQLPDETGTPANDLPF